MNDEFDFEAYQASIHRAGRTMLSIGVFLLLAAPFMMAAITGSTIEWSAFFRAIVSVLIVYVPSCVVEYLIYVPLLGAGASYT